jgi:hypothetical protein
MPCTRATMQEKICIFVGLLSAFNRKFHVSLSSEAEVMDSLNEVIKKEAEVMDSLNKFIYFFFFFLY